jgi:DNA-binding NarL/FixJ family response regulator
MNVLANPTVLKIMTVEDSHFIIKRLQAILDDVGGVHFVGNAASMTDALTLIEQQRPDVLFLDIRLGNRGTKTGVDLLSVVNKKYPAITVVMLTNLSGERYRTLCAREGADFFLDKSRDFDKIPETIEQIMDERY